MTDVRLGHDLDAVPVANATERTAPTWEARALAAVYHYRQSDPDGWRQYLAEADDLAGADAAITD